MPTEFDEQALFQVGQYLQQSRYRFVTVSPTTHARVLARGQGWEATSLRDIFGWNMPFKKTLLPAALFQLLQRTEVLEETVGLWRSKVRFSTLGQCIYVHSSYPTLDAESVFFGPDTYRFAALISRTMNSLGLDFSGSVVDVGCGTGVGGIVAVKELQDRATRCILADINPCALNLARVNVALAGVQNASFHLGNLFDSIQDPVDMILANPPYLLDAQERVYRHGGGILGSGLSRRIVLEGLQRLSAEGILVLYTGAAIVEGEDTFWQSVEPVLDDLKVHYEYSEIDPDVFGEELENPAYSGVERIAAVGLVVCKSRRVAATSRHSLQGAQGQVLKSSPFA